MKNYLGWIGDLEGVLGEVPVEGWRIMMQFRVPEVMIYGIGESAAADRVATVGVTEA